MRPTVAIIGGGISGLAAAYELHSLGVPFVVLERAAQCGGVVRTDRVDGYTIDAGPDALVAQKPAAIDLCRELGLAERLRPQITRATFVVRQGELHELPEASVLGIPTRWLPFATTRAFSWRGKLRMAAEVLVPQRRMDTDESIASFMRRRFGQEAVDYLAEPLLAGIHGGDPKRLSMRSAFPRLLDLEAAHGSVIVGLRKTRGSRTGSSPGGTSPFVALPGGMEELTDALLARLPRGSIQPNACIEALTRAADGFAIHFAHGGQLVAPLVLMATPAGATARLVASLDPQLAELCGRIRSVSVATVALGYARHAVSHPLNGTGFIVPRREGLRIRALSWVSSKWTGRAPDGHVLLRAYIGGAGDPDAVDVPDQELTDIVQREITPLLGILDTPDVSRVYRWRDATPQLEVGHGVLMKAIDQRLETMSRLAVTASGFRGTGIADCVEDGRRQARQLAERMALALTA